MSEKTLKINPDNLVMECAVHSSHLHEVCEGYAQADYAEKKADANLKLVKAEIDLDVRQRPEHYGLSKLTEAVVSSAVEASKEVQTAVNEYLEARKAKNNTFALQTAWIDRGHQLRSEVEMFVRAQGLVDHNEPFRSAERKMTEHAEKKASKGTASRSNLKDRNKKE